MSYTVIVDYGHAFYRCYSIAMQAPPTTDLIDTTVYHFQGILRTLHKELAKRNIHEYDLIFAEDRRADRKLSLMPGYRAGRADKHDDKEKVKNSLKSSGVKGHWCYSIGNEADDVIATLVRKASTKQGLFTIIVSSDRDLWQLIGPTVSIFNPMKRALVTPADIQEHFRGLGPTQVPLFKALWGDATDCIPNAIPRTQRQLVPILRLTGSGHLDEFNAHLEAHWASLTPKCRELLRKGKTQVYINWQLAKLDSYCTLSWD